MSREGWLYYLSLEVACTWLSEKTGRRVHPLWYPSIVYEPVPTFARCPLLDLCFRQKQEITQCDRQHISPQTSANTQHTHKHKHTHAQLLAHNTHQLTDNTYPHKHLLTHNTHEHVHVNPPVTTICCCCNNLIVTGIHSPLLASYFDICVALSINFMFAFHNITIKIHIC